MVDRSLLRRSLRALEMASGIERNYQLNLVNWLILKLQTETAFSFVLS